MQKRFDANAKSFRTIRFLALFLLASFSNPSLAQDQYTPSESDLAVVQDFVMAQKSHFDRAIISDVSIRECETGTIPLDNVGRVPAAFCDYCYSPGSIGLKSFKSCMSGLYGSNQATFFPEHNRWQISHPGPEITFRCRSQDCSVERDRTNKQVRVFFQETDAFIRALTAEAGSEHTEVLDATSMITRLSFEELFNTFANDEDVLRAREVYPSTTAENDSLVDAAREKLVTSITIPTWGECRLHLFLGGRLHLFCALSGKGS